MPNKSDKEEKMITKYFNNLKKYKKKYGEKTLLLLQCGSFYEVYSPIDKDGEYLNKSFQDYLNITNMNAAASNKPYFDESGKKYPVKMAGFTHGEYYLEKWVKVLINNGYTVAVWDEDGMMGKSKTRSESVIFSPGCTFSVEKKEEDTNNIACYVINVSSGFMNKNPSIYFGCSVIDAFTGTVKIFEHRITKPDIHNTTIFDELERFNAIYNPNEIIIIHNYTEDNKVKDIIQFADLDTKSIHIINENDKEDKNSVQANNCNNQTFQKQIILKFYEDIKDYDSYMESSMLNVNPFALRSLCFLLDFIWLHNANLTNKLQKPSFDNVTNRLLLANHSLRQLNIVSLSNNKGKNSSVEKLINKCVTPMGRRYLKDKILHPVTNVKYLNEQFNMIEYLINNWEQYEFLRKSFQNIKDIEHLYRKIIFNKISPNDLFIFNKNLHTIKEIHNNLKSDNTIMKYIKKNIGTDIEIVCNKLILLLERNLNMKICETLVNNKFEINFMNHGINEVLDDVSKEYDDILSKKENWINTLHFIVGQKKEYGKNVIKTHITEKSGMYFYATPARCRCIMENLKVTDGFPNVVINGLDFSTFKHTSGGISGNHKLGGNALSQFYKKYGQKLDNLIEILTNVYTDFIISLRDYDKEMNDFVKYVSNLDMLTTKAYVSKSNNYCKPVINSKAKKAFIEAKDIRHPLIEKIQLNETYVPNDVSIGKKKDGMLIFGTNGVGKSSINRSIGISVIMAQAGMFVPCSSFKFKPYNSIYTRILGNDNIFKGLSTFTVEMSEVSTFINNCDENSLILGDEVCSGTETSSAVSIFATVLLWLNQKKSSHIFASHFHQLTTMKEIVSLKSLAIKHMSVKNIGGTLYYTRKLEDGPGENMYGIEVCKSFDFPETFIDKTYELRNKYNKKLCGTLKKKKSKYNSKKLKGNCEFCDREGVDIHHLEPQEKAGINNYIKTFHKNHPANLTNICKECHAEFTKKKIIHRKTKTTDGYKLVEQYCA